MVKNQSGTEWPKTHVGSENVMKFLNFVSGHNKVATNKNAQKHSVAPHVE